MYLSCFSSSAHEHGIQAVFNNVPLTKFVHVFLDSMRLTAPFSVFRGAETSPFPAPYGATGFGLTPSSTVTFYFRRLLVHAVRDDFPSIVLSYFPSPLPPCIVYSSEYCPRRTIPFGHDGFFSVGSSYIGLTFHPI